jgi:predicted nucleic-acid-binding Zn-ribbon protein
MNTGLCPKCGSKNVYRRSFTFWNGSFADMMNITLWRKAHPDRFVCVDCGFMETYVSDPTARTTIAQTWTRVASS